MVYLSRAFSTFRSPTFQILAKSMIGKTTWTFRDCCPIIQFAPFIVSVTQWCGIDCKLLVKTMLGWESCCTVKINDCLQLIVLVLFTLWKMTKNKDGSKAKHWESDYQVNVEVFFKQQDSWSLQTLFLFLFQVI